MLRTKVGVQVPKFLASRGRIIYPMKLRIAKADICLIPQRLISVLYPPWPVKRRALTFFIFIH